jgi:hypothetical protein
MPPRANNINHIGAGESGKSTILKQMRLIYTKDGFSKNEKEEWRIIIFQNIIDGLRMIVDAMEDFKIPFEYENTTVSLQFAPTTVKGNVDALVSGSNTSPR